MQILEKIKFELLANEGKGAESIHACYPSPEWNTFSWSYALLRDLLLWRDFCDSTKETTGFIAQWFYKMFFRDRFSYHGDASRKVYLYQMLLKKKKFKKILIPEVGPCGFDVLPCVMAGYEEIHVFDVSPVYIEFCKKIWGHRISHYQVSSTQDFLEKGSIDSDFDVIVPDWVHDGGKMKAKFSSLNLIQYAESSHFQHQKQLKPKDYFDFFEHVKLVKV